MFVQAIHHQGRRQILVLPPEGSSVISLRTLDVPTPRLEPMKLEEVKAALLSKVGKAIRSTDSEAVRPLLDSQPRERRIPAASGLVA